MWQCGSCGFRAAESHQDILCFRSAAKAILLIGSRKPEVKRFYEQFVRIADQVCDEHIAELEAEDEKERKHGGTTSVQGASGQDVPGSTKPRRGKN